MNYDILYSPIRTLYSSSTRLTRILLLPVPHHRGGLFLSQNRLIIMCISPAPPEIQQEEGGVTPLRQ